VYLELYGINKKKKEKEKMKRILQNIGNGEKNTKKTGVVSILRFIFIYV